METQKSSLSRSCWGIFRTRDRDCDSEFGVGDTAHSYTAQHVHDIRLLVHEVFERSYHFGILMVHANRNRLTQELAQCRH